MSTISTFGRKCFLFSCIPAALSFKRMTMKSEIVIQLLKIMLRKFLKTKIIVCQNVYFMINFLNSYDGSRRRRDRSKRSHHGQSPENDVKQQRRHRKPTSNYSREKNEAVRAKVSLQFFSNQLNETHFYGKNLINNCL